MSATTLRAALAATAIAAIPFAGAASAQPVDDGTPNRPEIEPAFPEQTDAPESISTFVAAPQEVAGGLEHPWAIEVLPAGEGYLVTERPGRLRHISRDGVVSAPISGVPEVFSVSQGGLLDVAIAPDFAVSRVIYLTYAKPMGFGHSSTAAMRARLSEDRGSLQEATEIFVQRPASVIPIHFGSRILPGPDDTLWITTGERGGTAGARDLAQSVPAAYGAVLRVTQSGEAVAGNPFPDAEWPGPLRVTLGQRNIQGAAVHPETGDLWTVEHGPAGGDELNLIEAGGNYGWPRVSYGVNYNGAEIGDGRAAHAPDYIEPVYYWDPVIAPGGMAFYAPPDGAEMFPEWSGDLLIAGLQAAAVVRLSFDPNGRVSEEERLGTGHGHGRVRDVAIDEDGSILYVTDFADGQLLRLTRQ